MRKHRKRFRLLSPPGCDRARPHFEDATWEAFRLAWLDQQPATTAAAQLGMPVAGVYLAKSRVLKRLREEVMAIAED